MTCTANVVSACDLGRRIRFVTEDGALIEDELVSLFADRGEDGKSVVRFAVKSIRPSGANFAHRFNSMFVVSGSARVELTDKE